MHNLIYRKAAALGIAFVLMCVVFCSCTDDNQSSEVLSTENNYEEGNIPESNTSETSAQGEFEHYVSVPDDFLREHKGKTILVWAVPGDLPDYQSEIYKKFNQMIDEKGINAAVYFYQVPVEFDEYADYVQNLYGADILTSHFAFPEEFKMNTLVASGRILVWNEYLNSENGEKLKEQYDDLAWKSVSDQGLIYALPCSGMPDEVVYHSISINEDIALQCGYDPERMASDTQYFWECITSFSDNSEYDDIKPLIWNYDFGMDYLIPEKVIPWSTTPIAFRVTDGTVEAINVYEDSEISESMRAYCLLRGEGKILVTDADNQGEIIDRLNQGKYLACLSEYGTVLPGAFNYNTPIVYENRRGLTKAVYSSSEHPEIAMEVLSAIYTDANLSNLLAYGIEGENYELHDGEVVELNDQYTPFAPRYLSNMSIIYPISGLNRRTVCKEGEVENSLQNPLLGTILDYSEISEELTQVLQLQSYYEYFTDGSNVVTEESFEKKYSELKADVEGAGIQDVLKSINEQLHERGLQ